MALLKIQIQFSSNYYGCVVTAFVFFFYFIWYGWIFFFRWVGVCFFCISAICFVFDNTLIYPLIIHWIYQRNYRIRDSKKWKCEYVCMFTTLIEKNKPEWEINHKLLSLITLWMALRKWKKESSKWSYWSYMLLYKMHSLLFCFLFFSIYHLGDGTCSWWSMSYYFCFWR